MSLIQFAHLTAHICPNFCLLMFKVSIEANEQLMNVILGVDFLINVFEVQVTFLVEFGCMDCSHWVAAKTRFSSANS